MQNVKRQTMSRVSRPASILRGLRGRQVVDRVGIGALALVAVVLAGVSGSPSVSAQDDVARPVFEQVAGPYQITAIADPISALVGRNFLYVDVDDANTGAALSDVVVRVSMQRAAPDAELTWSQAGRPAEKSPLAKFRATLNLDGPGTWLVGVEVSGPLGSETVHLSPVEVPPRTRSAAGVAVLAAILVIFGGGFAYLWWSARKAQGRQPPPGSRVADQPTA